MSSREIYTDRRTAGLLLLPTILVSLVFLYYPAARAARRALYSSQLGLDDEFVGLENFIELLTSGGYRSRLLLTVGFAAVVVAGVMVVALLLTFLVHEVGTGKSIYLVAAIWPYALPPAVAALVFIFLVHPTLGVLSGPLATLGVDLDWFADSRQANQSRSTPSVASGPLRTPSVGWTRKMNTSAATAGGSAYGQIAATR